MSMVKYAGKRDKWYTYNSKLVSENDEVFCAVKFARLTETGTLVLTGQDGEMKVTHKTGSGKWKLLKAGAEDEEEPSNILMTVSKPKALRTRLIISEMADGAVSRKVVLQSRTKGSSIGDVRVADAKLSDEEAANAAEKDDGELLSTFHGKLLKNSFDVEKHQGEMSNLLFAFCYFMYVLMYRRKSSESASAGGTLCEYCCANLFANTDTACLYYSLWSGRFLMTNCFRLLVWLLLGGIFERQANERHANKRKLHCIGVPKFFSCRIYFERVGCFRKRQFRSMSTTRLICLFYSSTVVFRRSFPTILPVISILIRGSNFILYIRNIECRKANSCSGWKAVNRCVYYT